MNFNGPAMRDKPPVILSVLLTIIAGIFGIPSMLILLLISASVIRTAIGPYQYTDVYDEVFLQWCIPCIFLALTSIYLKMRVLDRNNAKITYSILIVIHLVIIVVTLNYHDLIGHSYLSEDALLRLRLIVATMAIVGPMPIFLRMKHDDDRSTAQSKKLYVALGALAAFFGITGLVAFIWGLGVNRDHTLHASQQAIFLLTYGAPAIYTSLSCLDLAVEGFQWKFSRPLSYILALAGISLIMVIPTATANFASLYPPNYITLLLALFAATIAGPVAIFLNAKYRPHII